MDEKWQLDLAQFLLQLAQGAFCIALCLAIWHYTDHSRTLTGLCFIAYWAGVLTKRYMR